MTTRPRRSPRADGERTRRAILLTAARLATVEGLDGLSIGRLARETGMSKSGLFAHFGSKEELQLATIAAADEIFEEDVLRPALAAEGLGRVEALCDRFLAHVERGVFPGGCFFASAAAELDTRPGRVRDRVAAVLSAWTGIMEEAVAAAVSSGEADPRTDPAQLAFEVNAMLAEANGRYLLSGDPAAFAMARRGIADRLERARAGGQAPSAQA